MSSHPNGGVIEPGSILIRFRGDVDLAVGDFVLDLVGVTKSLLSSDLRLGDLDVDLLDFVGVGVLFAVPFATGGVEAFSESVAVEKYLDFTVPLDVRSKSGCRIGDD